MDSKTQYRTALFESAAAVGTAVITTLVTVGLGLYFLARGAAAGDVAALMVWQLVLLVGGFGAVLFMVVVIGNVLAKLTKARGKAAQADNDALAAALAQFNDIRQLEAKTAEAKAKAIYQELRVDEARQRLALPAGDGGFIRDDLGVDELTIIRGMVE